MERHKNGVKHMGGGESAFIEGNRIYVVDWRVIGILIFILAIIILTSMVTLYYLSVYSEAILRAIAGLSGQSSWIVTNPELSNTQYEGYTLNLTG